MFEVALRHPRIFLVLSGIQLYFGFICLFLVAFTLGYAAHDPLVVSIPWYKWLIRCIEVADIICSLLAGRFGRSAALIYRVNNGETHRHYLGQAITANCVGICISATIVLAKTFTFSGWSLIAKPSEALRTAWLTLFFLFLTVKLGLQTMSLAVCVTCTWIDATKTHLHHHHSHGFANLELGLTNVESAIVESRTLVKGAA
ncbi:hypothetical protein BV898_00644 [Hypsibius exemplaris]|uniref:Transmembrane protein n=1 Tax=Hypsibius exemplaris TaxID=2072580 RepID=A0A1W0XE17_HYPEX|nr:hypothetical protein BV898_00644 [Hypsibius exemplaris]